MLSENAKKVLEFVKENEGNNITSADIAEATGLNRKQVDGIVTSAFQKKELMYREEASITLEDNTTKIVKYIKLTDAGKELNPDA